MAPLLFGRVCIANALAVHDTHMPTKFRDPVSVAMFVWTSRLDPCLCFYKDRSLPKEDQKLWTCIHSLCHKRSAIPFH